MKRLDADVVGASVHAHGRQRPAILMTASVVGQLWRRGDGEMHSAWFITSS
jgi:hypothetical protein